MRIASALILFVITVLVGGFGTLATLTSATSLQSASLAEPPSYPPEPSTHVLAETDTATPYTLSEFAHDSTDPIGDQSLNAKIARMIAVALQLRPLPITTQTTGTYAQGYTDADLERVLDIARRNNENTRSDINRSITDVTDGGTLQNVTIENGILDGLSVTGSTNFMSNVGIGTSTPSSKLHVTGGNEWLSMQIDGTVQPGINLVSNHINSSNGWHIMNEGNADRFTIRESRTGASVFSVENGAAASGGRVYITSAGNVGIGTISPLARLSVKGAGTTTGQLAQFTDSSNNPKVTVLDNGNIGIGTAMPAYTLHLAGTAPATDTDIALVPFDSSSKSTLRVFNSSGFQTQVTTFPSSSSVIWGVPIGDTSVYYSDGASTIYMNAGAGNSYFGTNGMVRQTISNTGNVGIGTTTPQTRLQVDGVITPALDNTYTLGSASYRFSEVYAANGVINTSDIRLKHDPQMLTYGLDTILALEPISYSWVDQPDQGIRFGLSAQHVRDLIPEIVAEGTDPNKTLGIRYTELIPIIINGIQELADKVATLAEGTFDTLFARTIVVEQAIEADVVTAREDLRTDGRLCLEDLCITRDDLAAILENQTGQGDASPATPSAPTPEPEVDTSEITDAYERPEPAESDTSEASEEAISPAEAMLADEEVAPADEQGIEGHEDTNDRRAVKIDSDLD
jgi:hypothetical protein